MIALTQEQQNEELFPVWNPDFLVTKSKTTDTDMLSFPIQNNKLLNFKHFKVLSMFDLKLDFSKVDRWGIAKYCDGTNSIKHICELVSSQNDVTEVAVRDNIRKMAQLGIIILK